MREQERQKAKYRPTVMIIDQLSAGQGWHKNMPPDHKHGWGCWHPAWIAVALGHVYFTQLVLC